MPVSPTYPGVYIEEIPSGVHTITGVATSITAFIGFTPRGLVNEPVHIFSFADYERAFGGLAVDSPLSYAVKHFFQNGGSEAYVVRVARGAKAAKVTLKNAGGANVLDISAASEGRWGNYLRVDVNYATGNPDSSFNLVVTELVQRNGVWVPGRTETQFTNLSMNSTDPNYVVNRVNADSQLIRVAKVANLSISGKGTSESGRLQQADIAKIDSATAPRTIGVVVDGKAPFEITLDRPTAGWTFPGVLTAIATDMQTKINQQLGLGAPPAGVEVDATAAGTDTLKATSPTTGEISAVRFIEAGNNSATATLKLGTANGGKESEAQATFRPQQNGTVGVKPTLGPSLPVSGTIDVDIRKGSSTTDLTASPVTLTLWDDPAAIPPTGRPTAKPTSLSELLAYLNDALRSSKEPLVASAVADALGGAARIRPDPSNHDLSFVISGGQSSDLGLSGTGVVQNVGAYAPGVGPDAFGEAGAEVGFDGTPPGTTELTGSEAAKTGIYALENVDIFNLLVMPDTTDIGVLSEAIAYCVRRRAFMIIDAPDTLATFTSAQDWISGPKSTPLRSRNAALYFPRLREPDQLMNNQVRSFPAAGAMAGLYARTDGERGVWKAPAGTGAMIIGATGLALTLTDKENGGLNPEGLNCLRTFPVVGTVAWGARTARGADRLADEYKYIPVRRLALFLEETFYRGTQWAVFEPNDEPLWAQIRLNLGAFMHTLFAQGAFQGRTPREAYFVKCDKETTTQNDIDLGRVNILIGFAPLKPAEFVIIQIQQIAGQIQT